MKDLLNREIQPGNYIAYALTVGRSANLAVYLVKEVFEDKIKAVKIDESYGGWNVPLKDGRKIPNKYAKFLYNPKGIGHFVEKSEEEKQKVDNKTSVLTKPERVLILDGFDSKLFE